MKIENVKISQIKANKSNPRVIKDHKFHKLVKSLLVLPKMLELRPIVVSNDMTILGGNMRFRALQHIAKLPEDERIKILESSNDYNIKKDSDKEKLKAYWNVFCDSPIVPIVKANELSDAEQKEFIIKDNASFGEWDFDCLANEWDVADLEDWGIDLPTFDIDEGEEEREIIEDEVPEVDEVNEPICKKGDIWQMGRHRLMCGDSTDKATVELLMNGNKADMWLTDPPYNVAYEGRTKEKLTILNDKLEDSDFRNFLNKAFALAADNLKCGGAFYIWHADSEGYNFRGALIENKLKIRECLIWVKNSFVIGRQDYQWKHEPCLYGWKDGAGHKWYNDRKQTTCLEFKKPLRNKEHPTMKPIELLAYLLKNSSKKGDIILDNFGGSGSTLIACEQLDRTCYMMELDPKYCDVIIARWEKLTNQKATKIN